MNFKYKGFTLIELLIVVSIIGILSAVLISVLNPNRQRNRAGEVVNGESIRKVAVAVEAYTSINGSYPVTANCNTGTTCGGYLSSWPLSKPLNVDEITYATDATFNYIVKVPSKLDSGKYLCYKGDTGKVYKNCPATCVSSAGVCTEGVL